MKYTLLTGFVLLALLPGCAMHVPMSDTLVFHEASYPTKYKFPTNRRNGWGVAAAESFRPQGVLLESAKERWIGEGALVADIEPANSYARGGGFYLSHYSKRGFALSATLGIAMAGVDATVNMSRGYFLTASFSLAGGQAILLQRRIVKSRWGDMAIGVMYQRHYAIYDVDVRYREEPPAEYRYNGFLVSSIGIQHTLVGRSPDGSLGPIRLTGYAGYAPEFKQPVASISMVFGAF